MHEFVQNSGDFLTSIGLEGGTPLHQKLFFAYLHDLEHVRKKNKKL